MSNDTTNWRTPPAKIPDSEIVEEFTADVVVVGLGHAGVPAVRAAVEAGASVIGFEKSPMRLWWAWGQDIGHINSKFLAGKGVPRVDPIEYFNEWMRRSGNRANPKLIMQFCQKCGEAFDWYLEPVTEEEKATIEVAFWPAGKKFTGEISGQKFWTGTVEFPEKMVFWERIHPVKKSGEIKESELTPYGIEKKKLEGLYTLTQLLWSNMEYAKSKGASLFFGMNAQQLVMDGDRITGVIAKDVHGKYVKYSAKKGVILATGDFGGNKEMCRDLLTDISDLFDEGEDFRFFGRDGRGIQMGVWAGGRMEPRPVPAMGGNFITLISAVHNFGTLWIDEGGQRFCNEAFGDPVFAGLAVAPLKHRTGYVVFDATIFDDLQAGPPAHQAFRPNDPVYINKLKDNMEAARKAGAKGAQIGDMMSASRLYSADSLETLADYAGLKGIAKQNFLETVRRYNEFAWTGRDEEFGKDPLLLNAIDTPPYFVQPMSMKDMMGFFLCTVGGLLTDERQNVLNQKKDPIPGLYATGNSCGRRYGPQYSTPTSGVSIGICLTLGREVGKTVAKLL
jgi:fumarate reductase flavoprotein subunit